MESNLHNGLKDTHIYDGLTDAQLYTHAPLFGLILLQIIFLCKSFTWVPSESGKSWQTKAKIIFSVLLVIAIATACLSYYYHHDLNDAELDNNSVSIAEMVSVSVSIVQTICLYIYVWFHQPKNISYEDPIFGLLFGGMGFSAVYATIMFVCGWIEYYKHDDHLKEIKKAEAEKLAAEKATREAARKLAVVKEAARKAVKEAAEEEETSDEKTGGARVKEETSKWSKHFVNYTLYHIQWHNWSCVLIYLILSVIYILFKNLVTS